MTTNRADINELLPLSPLPSGSDELSDSASDALDSDSAAPDSDFASLSGSTFVSGSDPVSGLGSELVSGSEAPVSGSEAPVSSVWTRVRVRPRISSKYSFMIEI